MATRLFLAIAGLAGASAAAIDAAARHLLAGDAYRLDLAATSARYGLVHAAALLGIAALLRQGGGLCLRVAGWFLAIGVVLFCGSLDLIVLGGPHSVALATPWGGTALIAGWVAVLVAALRPRRAD